MFSLVIHLWILPVYCIAIFVRAIWIVRAVRWRSLYKGARLTAFYCSCSRLTSASDSNASCPSASSSTRAAAQEADNDEQCVQKQLLFRPAAAAATENAVLIIVSEGQNRVQGVREWLPEGVPSAQCPPVAMPLCVSSVLRSLLRADFTVECWRLRCAAG